MVFPPANGSWPIGDKASWRLVAACHLQQQLGIGQTRPWSRISLRKGLELLGGRVPGSKYRLAEDKSKIVEDKSDRRYTLAWSKSKNMEDKFDRRAANRPGEEG